MKTLDDVEKTIHMQYALEALIEDYNFSETESDKYYTKLRLIEYIKQFQIDLSKLLNYMYLSEEKFSPFISMLKDIKQESFNMSKDRQVGQDRPIKVQLLTFGGF